MYVHTCFSPAAGLAAGVTPAHRVQHHAPKHSACRDVGRAITKQPASTPPNIMTTPASVAPQVAVSQQASDFQMFEDLGLKSSPLPITLQPKSTNQNMTLEITPASVALQAPVSQEGSELQMLEQLGLKLSPLPVNFGAPGGSKSKWSLDTPMQLEPLPVRMPADYCDCDDEDEWADWLEFGDAPQQVDNNFSPSPKKRSAAVAPAEAKASAAPSPWASGSQFEFNAKPFPFTLEKSDGAGNAVGHTACPVQKVVPQASSANRFAISPENFEAYARSIQPLSVTAKSETRRTRGARRGNQSRHDSSPPKSASPDPVPASNGSRLAAVGEAVASDTVLAGTGDVTTSGL